jgi:hypothetical protein
MTAPPTIPTSAKSRGHSLFDRQAQLHADESDRASQHILTTLSDMPIPPPKPLHLLASVPASTSSTTQYSPILVHRRSPIPASERHISASHNSVQLIGVHPRPESTYIKDWPTLPPVPTIPPKQLEQLLETDFPLVENSAAQESLPASTIMPSDSLCCAMVEQAFDYLKIHDDDDDVIHGKNLPRNQDDPSDNIEIYGNEETSDGNDSVDTIDLDATTSTNYQNDSKSIQIDLLYPDYIKKPPIFLEAIQS